MLRAMRGESATGRQIEGGMKGLEDKHRIDPKSGAHL
jgi:hypothetical protein